MSISVTAPISRAIDRAIHVTFRPFRLGKWFVLGFVAWLSGLGEGGCSGGVGGSGGGGPPGPGGTTGTGNDSEEFKEIWNWLSAHLVEFALIGLIVLAALIGLWLLILWLSSRGRFMFLEAVSHNTCEVAAPWRRYRRLGNSLFGFRVSLTLIWMVLTGLVIGLALVLAWPDIRAQRFDSRAITAIVVGLALLLPQALIFGVLSWCTSNFVATIMYARDINVLPAWREFYQNVVSGHIGTLILFFLMQLLLSIAVGIAAMLIGCATCCIGFLPYLSTVLTLPLQVFRLCYPVYFLQQFDPRYVIIHEPPPPGGFAVIDAPDIDRGPAGL